MRRRKNSLQQMVSPGAGIISLAVPRVKTAIYLNQINFVLRIQLLSTLQISKPDEKFTMTHKIFLIHVR